jgi:hypothetical protein
MTKEEFISKQQSASNISGKEAVIAVSLVLLVGVFFGGIVPMLIDTVRSHVQPEWLEDSIITGILVIALIVLIVSYQFLVRFLRLRMIRCGLVCPSCGIPLYGANGRAVAATGCCARCGQKVIEGLPEPAAEIPKQKPKSFGAQIGLIVGSVFGALIGRYCGISLLVPFAMAVGMLLLLNKIPSSPKVFRLAWSVQAAHALWMCIGGAVTGLWSKVAIDIIILVAGLAWLWVRPGLGPVILLGVYQLAAGVSNVISLIGAQIASEQHKALAAHLFLRLAAVVLLIAGYIQIRKQQNESQNAA